MMVSSIGSTASSLALQAWSAGSSRPAAPDPQEIFNSLDVDGDGNVTLEEMQALPAPQGHGGPGGAAGAGGQEPPSAEEMFAGLDGDGDGMVSFAEFEARRPPEPPQGPPPAMASGTIDLASLFGSTDQDLSGSLLAMMA